MKGSKVWVRVIITALVVLAVTSCGTPTSEPVQPTEVVAPTEVPEEPTPLPTEPPEVPQELTIGLGRDLWYGRETWFTLHDMCKVWESLLTLDNDMRIVPVLATSWESNEDATVWTFHLRQGIKFQDGTPFNADTVVFNIPKLQQGRTIIPNLDSVEKVDEYTVRFILTKATVALPLRMTGTTSAMLSPTTLADDGWLDTPIGTGPFKFVEYIEGDRIILERNEDYWGEPAKLQKVTFRSIPDATTRLAALQTGEIDAISDVGVLLPEQASIVEDHPDLVLLQQDTSTTHYLTFNSGKPPFDDMRLRQAVSMAVDLQSLVDNTLFGFGDPGVSVITSRAKDWARTDIAAPYDLAAAKALAEEVLGGERVEVRLVLHSGLLGRWPYESMSQIFQAVVADLGIDITIDTVEGGAWVEALKVGDYNMTMMPYTLVPADPDYFFGRWIWSEGFHNVGRSYGYANDRADELVLAAISEPDLAARKALYDELQAIVAEEVPTIPLYDEVTIYATQNTVKDFSMDVQFQPSISKAYRIAE